MQRTAHRRTEREQARWALMHGSGNPVNAPLNGRAPSYALTPGGTPKRPCARHGRPDRCWRRGQA